ncbi:hypothetical protein PENTCL1PPCAC_5223 [Pristionchus entomophagus]|uniref:Uncharacterized protein n=1 Tax=Pristionchus entomophagus TaxID=358040 RepID=A0AAV5SLQ1_9BILA|nr:hypothetical protein PENTCL1PPCAC_5223 [Pristionchus entomophagus]
MELPTMESCSIAAPNNHLLINDEILVHLVRNSIRSLFIRQEVSTTITATGLIEAFETVYKSGTKREVSCSVPTSVMNSFVSMMDARFKLEGRVPDYAFITHCESGANLSFWYRRPVRHSYADAGWHQQVESYYVEMRTTY